MKREREEQMDPIPYIEDSFLSKIFVKYRTLPLLDFFLFFFYRNSSYPRQLPTNTPPHTTMGVPFESKVVGASLLLFHSKGNQPLVNRSPTSFSSKHIF